MDVMHLVKTSNIWLSGKDRERKRVAFDYPDLFEFYSAIFFLSCLNIVLSSGSKYSYVSFEDRNHSVFRREFAFVFDLGQS